MPLSQCVAISLSSNSLIWKSSSTLNIEFTNRKILRFNLWKINRNKIIVENFCFVNHANQKNSRKSTCHNLTRFTINNWLRNVLPDFGHKFSISDTIHVESFGNLCTPLVPRYIHITSQIKRCVPYRAITRGHRMWRESMIEQDKRGIIRHQVSPPNPFNETSGKTVDDCIDLLSRLYV